MTQQNTELTTKQMGRQLDDWYSSGQNCKCPHIHSIKGREIRAEYQKVLALREGISD